MVTGPLRLLTLTRPSGLIVYDLWNSSRTSASAGTVAAARITLKRTTQKVAFRLIGISLSSAARLDVAGVEWLYELNGCRVPRLVTKGRTDERYPVRAAGGLSGASRRTYR